MKLDPYKHHERYIKWKENVLLNGIEGISEYNSNLILQYLSDMERGINIAVKSVKGSRSFIRLNTLRDKLKFLSTKFNELFGLEKITDISEEQLIGFFADMKNGTIKKADGENYSSVDTYSKVFKAFWHWYQKTNKKRGIEIAEITSDVDTKQEKPNWVYLTEEQVKEFCDNAKPEYKVLIMFLFDTGIRAPTELMNIKVSDFYNDYKEVNIREETSKTFGRRIKLMLCSEMIKSYVKKQELKIEDYVFQISPPVTNQYLKRLATRLFGSSVSPAGERYANLTMYDFRHISCCYWLPRYKSESALKYRFGWKKSDKIHYYSELLGMKDTISEEDMLLDITKTEIEKRLLQSEKEKEILQERLANVELKMTEMLNWAKKLDSSVDQL